MPPLTWDKFFGQEKAKKSLQTWCRAAKLRGGPVGHILLFGPPGLGKTTLANIIANEQGSEFYPFHNSKNVTLEALLNVMGKLNKETPDVIFMDEIHSLPGEISESLYKAMQDSTIDEEVGGEIKHWIVPPFTLIGATTEPGKLHKALRDRFPIKVELEPYSVGELADMVSDYASENDVDILPAAADEIAKRSHGVARIALHYLERAIDVAWTEQKAILDANVVQQSFELLGVDEYGLESIHYRYLGRLFDSGQKMGLDALALSLGESGETIKNIIESPLLGMALIDRTPRGRILTDRGRQMVRRSRNVARS